MIASIASSVLDASEMTPAVVAAVPRSAPPRVHPVPSTSANRIGLLRLLAPVRRHPLALILLLALAIRVALLATPRSYFPDEIFQYLEPAHRLVFGPGVVPWEYRLGVRSWLIPMLLAGPMALGGWIDPAGDAYLMLPKLLLVLVSLGVIAAAAAIGGRVSSRHGLFAALACAIWSETALFGTQALTEAIAVTPILAAAALLADRKARAERILLAGALLVLGVVIRFQYGPAVAALGAIACGRDRRCWVLMAAGAGTALAAAAGFDLAMGQRPFGWIAENFHQNIALKRSHSSTDGPDFYPMAIIAAFGIATIPLLALAARQARRFPALTVCALVNIIAHSVIAHKEYRYVLLSTTILVLLAGIGTVDAIEDAKRRWGRPRQWLPTAVAAWIAFSIGTYATSVMSRFWSRVTPELQAFATLRETPGVCGVAVVGHLWAFTGGHTWLHRPVPLYIAEDAAAPPAQWVANAQAGFDAIMAPTGLQTALPPAYRRTACFGSGRACLYERAGGCDRRAAARYEINRVLVRIDR